MRILAIPEPAGGELKVDGMPLHRVTLGTFLEQGERDAAWAAFLAQLQAGARPGESG